MPDFIFPDDVYDAAPTLIPIAVDLDDVPTARRSKGHPPCYAPCEGCGAPVLHGQTADGVRVALDTGVRTYTVLWQNHVPVPTLALSRAYPAHRCQP